MTKKEIIKTLELIAIYMEIKGENPFKTSAYRKAAQALEADPRTMSEIEDPAVLKGIGKGTAEVIAELRSSGQSTVLVELKAELPEGLLPLLKLPGLGGKKIGKLYRELGITDIEQLKQACTDHKVQTLAGFGKKTEEKIIAAIAEVGERPDRLPIGFVLPIATEIEQQLSQFAEIEQYSRAGSLRRMKETVKDLDFIIATAQPNVVREQLLTLNSLSKVIANGETKVSIELSYEYNISVDFRLVEKQAFATTLHHFTGSKEHNVKMRQLAKERGEKISEYGVEDSNSGEVRTFASEHEFFKHFGLHYIPPEAREDRGEVERFTQSVDFINSAQIRGDLHMHSTWSDGAHSIEEMAEAARKKGYSYMAITDHSKFLKVANGLTEAQLKQQRAEIDRLNERFDDFTILAGIEMDILPDGTLDYDDETMADMDLVIASIHSGFSQDRETIMKRLTTALKNKHVDLIAHPTGRLIGRRKGYDVDVDLLIELAKETNTALELNANPNRLDLSATWLRKAQAQGVPIAINTDAHHIEMLEDMAIGVGTAKKALLQKNTVLNTWTIEELQQFLQR